MVALYVSADPLCVPAPLSAPRLGQFLQENQLMWRPEKPTIPLRSCSVFLSSFGGRRNAFNKGNNFLLKSQWFIFRLR